MLAINLYVIAYAIMLTEHIQEFFQLSRGPFPCGVGGPGNEATIILPLPSSALYGAAAGAKSAHYFASETVFASLYIHHSDSLLGAAHC